MKINCGPSPRARRNQRVAELTRLQEWHDFYPLWPRRVGENDCRWFETIERKGRLWMNGAVNWEWEYRAKQVS